ncbi:RiPP maturation radical SAM C-methyltransferase [Archangium lipolyticum]|uniref:RiPP maturation radical SAM C-methyltransferase n=1 Tax=Archangium lipolyticum TaxID=2970465 RepID=UPI002149A220|nr:RiPP maturation radical SAM C-methyltransferase [Archangium lipolyticum]
MRVALVVMPLAAVNRPSLAAGLLQAAVKHRGIECHTKYFNVLLWKMLGAESYSFFCHEAPMTALAGEWAFSQAFYGRRGSAREAYAREVLDQPVWGLAPEKRTHVWALEELAPLFLRVAFESCDWGQYDLVGFTSTFEQTMPSLCLAKMIRERYPHVKLAAGGANFEADMGRQYMEHFEFLDYVATSEADTSFPQLCENLRDGRDEIPAGFLYRRGGAVHQSPRSRGSGSPELDALPTPDYEDYFRVMHTSAPQLAQGMWLPVEASRGCWWGARSHCTFCGLNGETMAFRRKSTRRVQEETEEIARRYGPIPLQFADNILGMDYFKDLLPYWAEQPARTEKFFEIKSNLKRRQVKQLRAAGITHVQAGVESVTDGILRVMRKGVTGAQNVALLRWCQEAGVESLWNVLYGFPQEDLDDYERTLSLLRKMVHLRPPDAVSPIRLDRFSPNHARWREHGFTRIAPMPAYRHIFPFPQETLEALAYYFDYEHPQFGQVLERGAALNAFCREWKERHQRRESGELAVRPHWQGGFVLIDSRFTVSPRSERLSAEALALLLACDAPASREQALRAVAGDSRSVDPTPVLERLIEQGVIASIGSLLVTLAILPEQLRAEELESTQKSPHGGEMSQQTKYLLTVDATGAVVKLERLGEAGDLTEVPLSTLGGFQHAATAVQAQPQPMVVNIYLGGQVQGGAALSVQPMQGGEAQVSFGPGSNARLTGPGGPGGIPSTLTGPGGPGGIPSTLGGSAGPAGTTNPGAGLAGPKGPGVGLQ